MTHRILSFFLNADKIIDISTRSICVNFVGQIIELVTKNHTTLKMDEDCLINTQLEYNPFTKMMEKVVD